MTDTPSDVPQVPFRRKFYNYPFVDKKLQFSFASLMAVIGLGNAIYFTVLFYIFSQNTFKKLVDYIPEYVPLESLLNQVTHSFLITVAWITIPEVVLVILWGLFFTHRVAGPVYAMNKKIQMISAGQIPSPVKLRKGDLLIDFADELNLAIGNLAAQREELVAALKDVQEGKSTSCENRLKKILQPAPAPVSSSPDAEPPTS